MKKKRVLSLVTVLALIIGVFSMIPSVSAVSDRPVKLIYAKAENTYPGIGATGYIEVENIDYNKNVTVHYSFNGTDWYDCAAEYYKPTWGNYEAWKFETPGISYGYRGSVTVQFAIKYEINGETYWDNNNGQNYSVAAGYDTTNRFDFGVGGIANFYANRYNNTINGTLELKNLGYEKDVKVIYTTDNWATSDEVNAEYFYTFEKNDYVELWNYTIPTSASDVQYKLSYTVNGVTYIDDNFGDYYTV